MIVLVNYELLILLVVQLETQVWYFDAEDKYDCEQKVRAVGQVRTWLSAAAVVM